MWLAQDWVLWQQGRILHVVLQPHRPLPHIFTHGRGLHPWWWCRQLPAGVKAGVIILASYIILTTLNAVASWAFQGARVVLYAGGLLESRACAAGNAAVVPGVRGVLLVLWHRWRPSIRPCYSSSSWTRLCRRSFPCCATMSRRRSRLSWLPASMPHVLSPLAPEGGLHPRRSLLTRPDPLVRP